MKHVAIVGSGIVGSTMAFLLARSGVRVTVLEKGPDYPYPHAQQFRERRLLLHENPSWKLPADLKRVVQSGSYRHSLDDEQLMGVGGASTQWGAMSDRMRQSDFQTRTRFGFGADWPISCDELELAYSRAEALLGVAGADGDPLAPRRAQPFPLPAFDFSGDVRLLADRLARSGIPLHPAPQARASRPWDGRPACANYNACENCPTGARYSPNHHLAQALATGRCRLETAAAVRQVLLDSRGSARGVVYRPNSGNTDLELAADAVVLAAGAIESARLLLLTKTSRAPDGLGNAGGQVGRNLLFHHFISGHLDFPTRMLAGRAGPESAQSLAFVDPPTRGRHGGLLFCLPSRPADWFHFFEPAWSSGTEVVRDLEGLGHCELIDLQAESAPSEKKYVQLSKEVDRFGDPFAQVHYEASEFDAETYRFAQSIFARAEAALKPRSSFLSPAADYASGAHHLGTCRMGLGPDDSVVDRHGQVHQVPRLLVVGGASFAGTGPVHPTLTMVAMAVRASDFIAAGLR